MRRSPITASSPATRSPEPPTPLRRSSTSSRPVGIDLPDVFLILENEGVEKFEKSWLELLEETQNQLDAAKK